MAGTTKHERPDTSGLTAPAVCRRFNFGELLFCDVDGDDTVPKVSKF